MESLDKHCCMQALMLNQTHDKSVETCDRTTFTMFFGCKKCQIYVWFHGKS